MSTSPCPSSANGWNPTPVGVAFVYTDEGLLVAKVGDNAFAMLPGPEGRFTLAFAWHLRGPMGEWKRSDFYGHGGDLEDETAFRARVAENAERQRIALARRQGSSPRRLHGALLSMPPSLLTELSVIRRQAMAASISTPVKTRGSIPAFARAAGMRKIGPGRL
jgi:hypothetical protein